METLQHKECINVDMYSKVQRHHLQEKEYISNKKVLFEISEKSSFSDVAIKMQNLIGN